VELLCCLSRCIQPVEDRFSVSPVLTHWIPDTPMTVETDASDYAIAAILSITLPDGEIHPVAFHSRTLTAPNLIMTLTTKNSWHLRGLSEMATLP